MEKNQSLRYRCPHCEQVVRIDESVMGKQVDCPHCGQPFRAESPVAQPLGPAAEGEDDAGAPAVMMSADDESELEVIRPAIFRRHFFGVILCVLLLFGGAGLIIFGAMTATLVVAPGLYFLIGGLLSALLGGLYLMKWCIIRKTHKLTITTERTEEMSRTASSRWAVPIMLVAKVSTGAS